MKPWAGYLIDALMVGNGVVGLIFAESRWSIGMFAAFVGFGLASILHRPSQKVSDDIIAIQRRHIDKLTGGSR